MYQRVLAWRDNQLYIGEFWQNYTLSYISEHFNIQRHCQYIGEFGRKIQSLYINEFYHTDITRYLLVSLGIEITNCAWVHVPGVYLDIY